MKIRAVAIVATSALVLSACSKGTAKDLAGDVYNTVKADYYDTSNVDVHTEEEMREFAVEKLHEIYGYDFTIDDEDDFYIYKQRNGDEDSDFYLNAFAYVEGDKSMICAFKVTEPNGFEDNFEKNYYKEDIEKYLRDQWKDIDGDYEISVNHDLNSRIWDKDADFKQYLFNSSTSIRVTTYIDEVSDYSVYIKYIRDWMDNLYGSDFDWSLYMYSTENSELLLYHLSPSDNGFTSSEDWSDDTIVEYIEDNIELYEAFGAR